MYLRKFAISAAVFSALAFSAGAAQATKYVGAFSGVTPTGWTDTTGLFGAANAVYSGASFSGTFTFDTADYTNSRTPTYPQFDAQGAATPGYSVAVTVNGVTASQPDTSSFYNPYSYAGVFGFDIGGWYGFFYLEADASAAASTALGITPAMIASGKLPSFSLTGSQLDQSTSEILLDDGQGGVLGALTPSTFSLMQVAALPETSTWAMMLVGVSAIGYAARRRRTVTAN